MAKKVLLTCLVCFAAAILPLHAVDFGIRGGLNFSSVPSSDEFTLFSNGWTDHMLEVPQSSHTGFHFGVFANFSYASLFVQPEFLFEETGQKLVLISQNNAAGNPEISSFTPKFSNIKIPITAGIEFGFLRIGAGPYYAYMLDNTRGFFDSISLDDGISFNYKDSRMGYQAMAGIRIGNISLDYRLEGSISRLGDGIDIGGAYADFNIRQRQHIISLGIVIF